MIDTSKKPEWLKKKINLSEEITSTERLIEKLGLNTVCEGALCPNRNECFTNKTATFMILGNNCTRNCRFCAVTKGKPEQLNLNEPLLVGEAAKLLGLKHIVVTSVTRDDLEDGGARHFAHTVVEIRNQNPEATIELLIPDLQGNWEALKIIIDAQPNILNHNLETVPSLYPVVRPEANYHRSLELLNRTKELNPYMITKSGIMVGLGENEEEIVSLMDDLREINVDMLTIGQYLSPSQEHLKVVEYIRPEQFDKYSAIGYKKGFKHVSSGVFVRSSYHADEGIKVF